MAFAQISHLAILLAAIAGWLTGALWYMSLSKVWIAALGKSRDQMEAERRSGLRGIAPFIIAFIAELLMAYVLSGAIGHLGPGNVTVRNGIISGAILWAGFVGTTVLVNNSFANRGTRLTVIDGGHWLAVLIVMGAIIGLFGG